MGGQLQRGFEAVGLAHSQWQKRSSTHWWGAEEVSVDEKYGWARAALAEIRRLGSYCRSCKSRSWPSGSRLGTTSSSPLLVHLGKLPL